jgi:hypothetical protein
MSIAMLLKKSVPGAKSTINGHIERGERIADGIQTRFSISEPRQWQAKHLRWFLERGTVNMASTSRYDFWRTARVLASALGRWPDWEPHLYGSWCKCGTGGRPPKLTQKSNR